MGVKSFIQGIAGGVVKPVADAITQVKVKKEETKQLETDIKGKLNLSDKEWDLVSKKNEKDSWKDEYLTIIWTAPIVLLLMGAVWHGIATDMTLFASISLAIDEINKLFANAQQAEFTYGEILLYVTLAGLGLKGFMNILKK